MRQRAVDLRAMERQARRAADFLRLLASEHRLLILCAVAEQERSVGEIATLPAIASRRAGQTIYYRLASEHVRPIIAHLHAMFCED
jgi:hypothetical protein